MELRRASSIFHETSDPAYSGAPLAAPRSETERAGPARAHRGGFLTSPVLARLDGRPDQRRSTSSPPARTATCTPGSAEAAKAGASRLPGAGRGPRQGRLDRPDHQPADVQLQRPRPNPAKTKTRASSSTPPRWPTSTVPASRRRSSSGHNEEYLVEQGDEGRDQRRRPRRPASLGVLGADRAAVVRQRPRVRDQGHGLGRLPLLDRRLPAQLVTAPSTAAGR